MNEEELARIVEEYLGLTAEDLEDLGISLEDYIDIEEKKIEREKEQQIPYDGYGCMSCRGCYQCFGTEY